MIDGICLADIDRFMRRVASPESWGGERPRQERDEEDPSPCFIDAAGHWRPVRREAELVLPVSGCHASVGPWLGRWWRLCIEGFVADDAIVLSSVSNDRELGAVVQDLAVHRENHPGPVSSAPIGSLHDGRWLAIADSGEVVIEGPGEVARVAAPDLPSFLRELRLF